MTIIRGVRILEAPCCGERYAAPNYLSMNFMAYAYWTDGWRDESLMPNDEGLRRCKCGQLFLQRDMVAVDTADSTDLQYAFHVRGDDLQTAIADSPTKAIEIAARIEYWRHLNHPYRKKYREHRTLEEAKAKRIHTKPVPDTRSWWDKFIKRLPKPQQELPKLPFTHPPFNPTDEQLENMARLCFLLEEERRENPSDRYVLELAELYREQGKFDEAMAMLRRAKEGMRDVTRRVLIIMISEKSNAPTRYKI